jgi:hypothetical protein
MERHRPSAREALVRGASNIAWHAHPNAALAAQIDHRQRRDDLDTGKPSCAELGPVQRIVPDRAVSFVA